MTQSTTLPPTPHYSTLYKKSQVLTEKSIKQLTKKFPSLVKAIKTINSTKKTLIKTLNSTKETLIKTLKAINSAKEPLIKTIISAKGATNV